MHRVLIVLATFCVAVACFALIETQGWRSGRVLECLVLSCALGVLAWACRGRLQNVAVMACSLALGLAVVQASFLFLRARPAQTMARFSDGGMIGPRDVLGWAPRHPGVYHLVKTGADGHVIFDVHATIGDLDYRETTPSAGEHPVAFFGDSFVFGDGLNDGDTLPQVFADLNHGRIPVLNLGFSGWAPSQNLAALGMEPLKSRLGRPVRIVLFTATFHVERIACKGQFASSVAPRYVLDGETVKYAGSCSGSMPRFVTAALSFVMGLLRPNPTAARLDAHDVETYLRVVETFVATARKDYGAETTVLMERGNDDDIEGTGYTQARIADALQAAGIDVLVKAPVPRGEEQLYRIPDEGHPNGLANRVTARQLEEHLRTVDPKALAD